MRDAAAGDRETRATSQDLEPWTVRGASLDDAEEITRLHRRAASTGFAHIFPPEAPPPSYEHDLERWRFWLGPDREQGRHAHTVRTSGRIVGVVLAGPDPDEASLGHLSRLYVDPDLWGAGVGTALYDATMTDLAGREFAAVTLWVLEDNLRAREWYERLGWTPTGRTKPTYEPAGIYDAQYIRRLDTDQRAARS